MQEWHGRDREGEKEEISDVLTSEKHKQEHKAA